MSRLGPLPDERIVKAPKLPTNRPPTRREVWEHAHALYFDRKGHKRTAACEEGCLHTPEGVMEDECRAEWVQRYAIWFNLYDWRKQPDWKEGEPVIEPAVPVSVFQIERRNDWVRTVYGCLNAAKERMAA